MLILMEFQDSYQICEISYGSIPAVEYVGKKHISCSVFLGGGEMGHSEQTYQPTTTKKTRSSTLPSLSLLIMYFVLSLTLVSLQELI